MQKQQNTPQFIKQLPWYAQDANGGGELIKIPVMEPKGFIQQWYNRAEKGYQSVAYRKGACDNCGAMGHNKKECTERPRKIGAKFSQQKIASDDIVRDIRTSWQVKRDRWNGFTSEMYGEVIDDYKKYEQVRKKIKGEQIDNQIKKTDDPLNTANLPTANIRQKFQGLGGNRNRQDVAKYLKDLNLNSAFFDPKSRSMVGQNEYLKQLTNLDAVGERATLEDQDRFAFEQVERHHAQLNSTALPTLTERIFNNVKQKRAGINSGKMGEIMRKYGSQALNNGLDIVVEEYQGGEMLTRAKRIIRSKYEQDVFINDHSSVWGSWYNIHLGWGYNCCHSNEKISYCLGTKGKERALARQLKVRMQQAKQIQKLRQLGEIEQRNKVQEEQREKEKQKEKQRQRQKEQQNEQENQQEKQLQQVKENDDQEQDE